MACTPAKLEDASMQSIERSRSQVPRWIERSKRMSQGGKQSQGDVDRLHSAVAPCDKRRIYVQIPAYRDRELLRTVQDLTKAAMNVDRLRIAIAWQYGPDEAYLEPELRACGHIELVKIPAEKSQGCNWARNMLQSGWNGEEYTLLLDSHYRFTRDWDQKVIEMFEAL